VAGSKAESGGNSRVEGAAELPGATGAVGHQQSPVAGRAWPQESISST
jgi:hypothetical protein